MKQWRNYFLLVLCAASSSCTVLKPHERVYINDPEMQLGADHSAAFGSYVHSIREGATPAGGAKASGGCGCN